MESCRFHILVLVSMLFSCPFVNSWGYDGHLITCRIAQTRLNKAAANAVMKLLPDFAHNDLGSVCSWADRIKPRYNWSSPLHHVNTDDNLCSYQYEKNCKDQNNVLGRCVVGAINNYTNQLLSFYNGTSKYSLTEALLFLSHFMGDIHQPLHVGFASDRGGNTIGVHWYGKIENLPLVWDSSIIQTETKKFYLSDVDKLIPTIRRNIMVCNSAGLDGCFKLRDGRPARKR
ncbi:endonuclease 2-like [Actinidia eriantha]|uniref:endonuclease 2-like n=1 Tax=Actinidia eriantha TaxID=165200 RepID=UPI00258AAFB2|nr:endonuclease 2-like [Actinidia eriantha]